MTQKHQATVAVRAGIDSDSQFGAVVPPIYLSTNYTFADFNLPRQYDYSRCGNPTRDLLAGALAELEQGAGAVVTATGMAAVNLVCSLLSPADLLVVPHDCYGGSYRLFDSLAKKGCFKVEFVDQGNAEALAQALARRPKLVWLETPSNPLLRVVDIEAICHKAHQVGARVAVDNTFLSPILQQPLTLGADLVVHSTTKYLNGHSDVVGGAVVANTLELAEELAWWANCLGLTGSALDSYLTLRGVRTLNARMRTHCDNAAVITAFLASHPQVRRVHHPSLESHPGHEIAARQQRGFGAMLSFELAGGEPQLRRFLKALQLFCLAESLGGVESLVCHPATMTHAAMDARAQRKAGINATLVRLSVGLEAAEDLIADLSYALDEAFG